MPNARRNPREKDDLSEYPKSSAIVSIGGDADSSTAIASWNHSFLNTFIGGPAPAAWKRRFRCRGLTPNAAARSLSDAFCEVPSQRLQICRTLLAKSGVDMLPGNDGSTVLEGTLSSAPCRCTM